MGNTGYAPQGGAESGALSAEPDSGGALADWLEACPVALSDETKAGILALVNLAGIATT